jgi:hypothetical protein
MEEKQDITQTAVTDDATVTVREQEDDGTDNHSGSHAGEKGDCVEVTFATPIHQKYGEPIDAHGNHDIHEENVDLWGRSFLIFSQQAIKQFFHNC